MKRLTSHFYNNMLSIFKYPFKGFLINSKKTLKYEKTKKQ